MILRRFIEKLRSENWTSVGIELAIVVLGVFLGLQAQEWSARREIDARAAEYSARLQSDFEAELWVRGFQREYYDDVRDSNERVLDALEGRIALDDEALLVEAFRATQYLQWYARPSTYEELISIGAVDMIRDASQRRLAQETFGSSLMGDIRREGDAAEFRRAFRSVVPLDVQRELARRCGDRKPQSDTLADLENPLDYPCETGLEPARVAESIAVIRAIPGVEPMLRLRVTQITTRIGALDANLEALKSFVAPKAP